MIKEEFKEFPIEEFKNRFKVSNKGKIWSNHKKNYLKTIFSNGNEIFFVNKNKKSIQFRIDNIIAISF